MRVLAAGLYLFSLLPAQPPAPKVPQSLFDGHSLAGWRGADGSAAPRGWTVDNGAIATIAQTAGRVDLISEKTFRDFDLTFEFRLSPGANTGVKYFVNHALRYLWEPLDSFGAAGLEMQLIDDNSPEALPANARNGALYALLPPEHPAKVLVNEWVSARIVCRQYQCEHWIAGRKVLGMDLRSPELQAHMKDAAANVSQSIISSLAARLALRRVDRPAHLSLQHHNGQAWFRNLRVSEP
jgi:hypothetical protein